MTSVAVLLLCAAGWVMFLVWERARLARLRRSVPLRIAVTGTRGKSSVTRMLAAVLRESGRTTLAKVTGSEAVLLLPNGEEKVIRRRGHPSILEQKRFITLAARANAAAAVGEIMSIHAENHLVEAQQLLDPHIVLVTNFRVDHTGAMGDTPEDIASVIALDVPEGSRVFVPREECVPAFSEAMSKRRAELVEVPPGSWPAQADGQHTFAQNLDLVCAVARSLGIEDETISRGVAQARDDKAAPGVWRYKATGSEEACLTVNAFAANDPESTMLVYDRTVGMMNGAARVCLGLMNLRADRGDRTMQWAEALENGLQTRFSRLYVSGLHAPALARRVRRSGSIPIEVLGTTRPAEVMRLVTSAGKTADSIVFGFGNIGGLGEAMVAHWSETGERLTTRPPYHPTA